MKTMWFSIAFGVVKAFYKAGGREMFKKAIDKPDSDIDEQILAAIDAFLGYVE